jgi:hypothetical protein
MTALAAVEWKDFVTLGLAVLGAGLGLLNTWSAVNQRRVRLRVKPVHVVTATGAPMFGIDVVNLSGFPVTVFEVGFTIGRTVDAARRLTVFQPILVDGKPWPRRLEGRTSVSVFLDPNSLPVGERIGRAYARTECGEARYGSSPALKQLRHALLAS